MDYSGWITDITPNPSGGNGGFGTGTGPPDPAWTSTLPNVALWTYKASGDLEVVRENYPHIVRWLKFCKITSTLRWLVVFGLILTETGCDYRSTVHELVAV